MWFIFLPRLRFFLVSHPPLSIGNSLPFTSLRSVTVGSGRGFLEGDTYKGQAHGLLECWLDPVHVVAGAGAHADGATAEDQVVRVVVPPWVSTWRPIPAAAAKVVQLIFDAVTQGGQVEVITCIGGGREARVVDTTASVGVGLRCSAQVGWTVGRFLGVVMTICL